MIIYEFSTWGAWKSENGMLSINEIEVEEKPKSYVGNRTRINKTDINILQKSYGNRMFRLDNNAQAYISAVIDTKKERITGLERSLNLEKAELTAWESLQRKEDDGK